MLPGVAAVQLYGCNDPAFPDCGRPSGERCVNTKGKAVPPHPKRWNLGTGYADAWNAQQSTIDGLTAHLGKAVAERDALQFDITGRDSRISQLEAANAALQKQVDDLTRPPEARVVTKFGGCPRKKETPEDVQVRWPGAAERIFCGTETAPRPQGASIVHISWKPTLAQITDSWVERVCANLMAGDCVEVWHESNKKVSDHKLTLADVTERKNTFHDIVKRLRPDLLVVNTLTGWALDPKSKTVLTPFMVRADVLGVDCDGVRPKKLPYTDYEDETAAALAIIADERNGYKYAAVPEFGCPRIPAQDPDGTVRAAYHDHYADEWAATGKFLFVTLYEYDSNPNYSLTTPAELNGWASRVAS